VAAGRRPARLCRPDEGRQDPLPTAERDALITHGVRAFVLANANLRAAEQAERIVTNLDRILALAEQRGPFIYGIYATGVRPLWTR
jgi:hypothetical protein